jgi:peptidoglycan-associated lipoprotein
MSSWKFLSVALLSVFMATACAKKEGATADDASSDSGRSSPEAVAVKAVPGSQKDLVVSVGDRVFFDYDANGLRPDQTASLDKLVTWLDKNSNARILISGHADERGTTEYNLALGERRANTVREYLIAGGVSAARLQTVSYGEERPAVLGSNENSWRQNRRAQFHVR